MHWTTGVNRETGLFVTAQIATDECNSCPDRMGRTMHARDGRCTRVTHAMLLKEQHPQVGQGSPCDTCCVFGRTFTHAKNMPQDHSARCWQAARAVDNYTVNDTAAECGLVAQLFAGSCHTEWLYLSDRYQTIGLVQVHVKSTQHFHSPGDQGPGIYKKDIGHTCNIRDGVTRDSFFAIPSRCE